MVAILLVAGAAWLVLRRRRGLELLAIASLLACSWAIYCLLPRDWMAEYRFATPFFLLGYLLLFAVAAEVLRHVRPARPAVGRAVFAACIAAVLLQSAFIYAPRSREFAAHPTAPFQGVARQVAMPFNTYADALGIADGSLLCPDVGAALYYSRLQVHDLGGLCDRRIGRLLDRDAKGIRDYVLDELQPTFIDLHDRLGVADGVSPR